MTDIDTILNPEPAQPTGEQTAEQRARDEHGRFVKQEAAAPEPVETEAVEAKVEPEPPKAREVDGYKAAMMEERRKRQELEARLRAQEQAKALPEPPPFWDDPEKAIDSRLERLRNELSSDYLNRYFNALESAARGRHQDYDDVRDVFIEHAAQNPALAGAMNNAQDPAEYAYQQGKLLRELSNVGGNFDGYRAKLEAEIRQKLEAEYRARNDVPRSLNSEQSSPVSNGGPWSPKSLEDLLPYKY